MLVNRLPMRSAIPGFLVCLMLANFLSGCTAKPPPSHPATTIPRAIGVVAVIDEAKRFVLIDLETNLFVPNPGAVLRAVGPNGESARLEASPEQKRPFIAAEIVEGNPAVGDQVFR